MNGLPRLREIRSISRYGLSAVTVVFEDGVDVYFARQLVNERLAQAREAIPPGLGNPEMGPVTTGLGDVFQFTVEGDGVSAMERRTILDWLIAPRLAGGARRHRGEHLGRAAQAVPGGGRSRKAPGSQDRTRGRFRGRGEGDAQRRRGLHRAQPGAVHPARRGPRRVARRHREDRPQGRRGRHAGDGRSIAQVREGAMLRIGVATIDGKGETVIGLVQMLAGENALQVATRARQAVEELQPSLPKGVRIVPYYDRAAFVRRVIRTVETNLLEGSVLVVAVLFAFLGNLRAGLIVASAIPLSMLLAFTGMVESRISANLMSLGAIDFGLIVDGAVVLVENVVRRLAGDEGARKTVRQITAEAAHEVVRPITFGDRHHHPGLPSDPDPRRHRGKDVQADGLDRRLRPRRFARSDADPHPRARVALPRETGRTTTSRASWRSCAALYLRALTVACRTAPLVLSVGLVAVMVGGLRRLEARRRVNPAARRGRPLDQRHPPRVGGHLRGRGRHRADGACAEEVPGGRHGREPVGKPRAGHGRHGNRGRRRLRHAQAEVRVDDGEDQGRAGRRR